MSHFKDRKLVLFDFDGVIVDTMQLSLSSFGDIGNKPLTPDAFRQLFMGNFYDSLSEIYGPEYWLQKKGEFQRHYGLGLMKLPPYKKINEALELIVKHRQAVIISSSQEQRITSYLKLHELDGYFSSVMGLETHKSKVRKLNIALDLFSLHKKEAVFITDTVGGVIEADEAGIDSIAVTWGFHPADWLKESPHHTLVNNMDELCDLFR